MNISEQSLHLLINVLENANSTININKVQNHTLEKLSIEFKLKLVHSKKIQNKDNLPKELIPLLKANKYIIPSLKILYLMNYKDKFDQCQIKRPSIHNFQYINVTERNGKKKVAYKNTQTINSLYQLHQVKHHSG